MRAVGPDPSVVGRECELQTIERFLAEGHGALVLDGEPGIGKTTVWARGIELAARRRVLLSRPAEVETALPFATLTDLLDPVLEDARRSMPEPQRQALDVALALRESESAFDERVVASATLTALRRLAEWSWYDDLDESLTSSRNASALELRFDLREPGAT